MGEGDHGCVQGQPGHLHTLWSVPAVQGIAQDRMSLGGKMYPDLMGAAGTQLGLHQGHGAEPDQRPHQGEGGPTASARRQRRAQGARPGAADMNEYAGRLVEYMTKVAREAKRHSSWLEPDEEYEHALAGLVEFAVTGSGATRFLEVFESVISAVCFHGLVNSLVQVLLKATCPGIGDFYQGTELLDLSLVDPDNRRPVNYGVRESFLREVAASGCSRASTVSGLVQSWPDARAKLYATAKVLQVRCAHADVFRKGAYIPLEVGGQMRNHVCSFMRSHRDAGIVVVAPLRSGMVAGHCLLPLGADVWGTEAVTLPPRSPQLFEDAFSGAHVQAQGGRILLADALAAFPVALLVGKRRDR